MTTVNWGIIGCGDVTEIKSGPAFKKVPNSSLVAVMRRQIDKAENYAQRHQVPKWYGSADELINDPAVNAIYIATPPDSHEQYALQAIAAGKPVYLEKPISVNYESAARIANEAERNNVKLVVAHYRRAWPLFKKLKEIIQEKLIGDIHLVKLKLFKTPFTKAQLAQENIAWRVNPKISGGGIFHDLAPHQLDILYYLFGNTEIVQGISLNQAGLYEADDLVLGAMLFKNQIAFTGSWYFHSPEPADLCEIIGTKGSICFSFFSNAGIKIVADNMSTTLEFETLQHVQQPMIAETVNYFLGNSTNPCSGHEACVSMKWMDNMVAKS